MKSASLLACGRVMAIAISSMACTSCSNQPEKFEKIPFTQIYATVPQQGMKRVVMAEQLPFDQDKLERFIKLRPQASNVFFSKARGLKGVDGAVFKAIWLDGRAELALPKSTEGSQLWLIAYFGFGRESPPRWIIASIERSQATIRINFEEPASDASEQGSVPNFLLLPLENLKPGGYELQLRDSAANEVAFMRKVEVTGVEP